MNRFLRRFAAIVLAASLGGCGRLVVGPAPGPAMPSKPITAEELIGNLDRRADSIRTFRALAAMKYVDGTEKLAVKQVVVVERPDHLRIEMMGAFGVAVLIAADGKTLRAYHRGERTFYSGKATQQNFARFARMQLDLSEVADLLIGIPPRKSRVGTPTMRFERPEGLWRVATTSASGDTVTVWFDPDGLMPTKSTEVDREGRVKYAASYLDYQTVAGVAMPARVRFEIPAQGAQVELRYSNLAVNATLEPNLFKFEAPGGARLVDLDKLPDGPFETPR